MRQTVTHSLFFYINICETAKDIQAMGIFKDILDLKKFQHPLKNLSYRRKRFLSQLFSQTQLLYEVIHTIIHHNRQQQSLRDTRFDG